MTSNYDVGTRAWQPDQLEGWIASEVEEKKVDGDKVTLVFRLANGEVHFSSIYLDGCFLHLYHLGKNHSNDSRCPTG